MQKQLPFTKDFITSTHPRFHVMVVKGQLKTQNLNENRDVQKWIKSCILKLIYLQKHFPKSIAIEQLKNIW